MWTKFNDVYKLTAMTDVTLYYSPDKGFYGMDYEISYDQSFSSIEQGYGKTFDEAKTELIENLIANKNTIEIAIAEIKKAHNPIT